MEVGYSYRHAGRILKTPEQERMEQYSHDLAQWKCQTSKSSSPPEKEIV